MLMRELSDLARRGVPLSVREEWRHRRGRYHPWEDGFDFNPPEPAIGEVAGPPSYVGIGVRGAGSVRFARWLRQQPSVRGLPGGLLGLDFFARFAAESFGEADIRRYSGWFARPAGVVVGEWSSKYLTQWWVPPLLVRAAPDTRLLVVLRDPVERYRAAMSKVSPVRALNVGQYDAAVLQGGRYGESLAQWIRHFPPEQLHVVQYEELMTEPMRALSAARRFLGLEPAPELTDLPGPDGSLVPLSAAARDRLIELYRPDVDALARIVPQLDLGRWSNFG